MALSRRIPKLLLLALGGGILVAAGGEAPIPWPHGNPPSSTTIREMAEHAILLDDRERMDEYLEAAEKGEDREHIFVLQSDIDFGIYTKEQMFRFGDSFFTHEFRKTDGYGASEPSSLARVHTGVYGGRDTFSCSGCHSLGGPDGAGSLTQNALVLGDGDRASSANIRNAPAVLGLGFVQLLGVQMSYDLGVLRDTAISNAQMGGQDATVELSSKGVSFGKLTAHPDGTIETKDIEGVDPDLVVKPFGWKGDVARLRRFAEEAARIHFGMQSHVLALGYEQNPDPAKLGPGPHWWDPDNDGVQREVEEGTLTASALYMAMLEAPVIVPPHDPELLVRWSNGMAVFEEAGCAHCHKPEMPLGLSIWNEMPDTTPGPGFELNVAVDGEQPRQTSLVKLFSDLKRHDMGEGLADKNESGSIGRSVFLTRPLWGLAESAPYLHDGRAATIPMAIDAHGGDAKKARDAWAALDPEDQKDLHVFLLSLTREPRVVVQR